jgi:hypothetical protein
MPLVVTLVCSTSRKARALLAQMFQVLRVLHLNLGCVLVDARTPELLRRSVAIKMEDVDSIVNKFMQATQLRLFAQPQSAWI